MARMPRVDTNLSGFKQPTVSANARLETQRPAKLRLKAPQTMSPETTVRPGGRSDTTTRRTTR